MSGLRSTVRPGGAGARLAAALLALGAAGARADWSWELPKELYGRLEIFERAQYDRGAQLLRAGQARAATVEFEKFLTQFPRSPAGSHVLFLQAYGLHQDRKREAAAQRYNEVLDLYGDRVNEAGAALYHLGLARLENGDDAEGYKALREMADDADYRQHPLAAGALRRLADNAWRNRQPDEALRYWKQAVADFAAANREEAGIARDNVIDYYVSERQPQAAGTWLLGDARDDPGRRVGTAAAVLDRANWRFGTDWDVFAGEQGAQRRKAAMQALFDWFAAQRPWFERQKRLWDWQSRAIAFAVTRLGDRVAAGQLVDEAAPDARALTDEDRRNDRLAWLCDRCADAGDFERALYLAQNIRRPDLAHYKVYELHARRQRWPEALAELDIVVAQGDAAGRRRALEARAWVYREHLRDYEKAIAAYNELNAPPGTLWGVQECYRRWGKMAPALGVLTEIESSFPDSAARAAWAAAECLAQFGERERALAAARHVLKAYPQSGESSRAHDFLERQGAATGGGVFDAE